VIRQSIEQAASERRKALWSQRMAVVHKKRRAKPRQRHDDGRDCEHQGGLMREGRRLDVAMAEDRLQPLLEAMVPKKSRQTEYAHRERSYREDQERPSHDAGRFVQVVLGM